MSHVNFLSLLLQETLWYCYWLYSQQFLQINGFISNKESFPVEVIILLGGYFPNCGNLDATSWSNEFLPIIGSRAKVVGMSSDVTNRLSDASHFTISYPMFWFDVCLPLIFWQSVTADVAAMTRDRDWTAEEKLYMEAEIIKRTAPPLNLSPSPLVAIINNKLHQRKYKFSTVPIKRAARRFSQVSFCVFVRLLW